MRALSVKVGHLSPAVFAIKNQMQPLGLAYLRTSVYPCIYIALLFVFFYFLLGKNLTLCQRQYQEYWKYPAMGRYVPRCKPDGSFDNIQCHGPYCFCVNQDGNKRSDSFMLLSEPSSISSDACPDKGKRKKVVTVLSSKCRKQ